MAKKVCQICKKGGDVKEVLIPVSYDDRPEGSVFDKTERFDLCLFHRYEVLRAIRGMSR